MLNPVPFPVIIPVTFNDDNNVEAPETYKLVKFVLFNKLVDVACKLDIFNEEVVDNELAFVPLIFK